MKVKVKRVAAKDGPRGHPGFRVITTDEREPLLIIDRDYEVVRQAVVKGILDAIEDQRTFSDPDLWDQFVSIVVAG